MKNLSLTIPGYSPIPAPSGIPTDVGINGSKVFQLGIQILLILSVVLALFFIIWAGVEWTMSGGDKEKLKNARNRLTYAIIGLIIVFISFFIISVVGGLTGVDLLKQTPT